MKRVLGVLILILSGLVSNGQRQPIQPYGHYSPEEVKTFALGNSAKAKQFTEAILRRTGEENIDSLFKKVYIVKDTLLEAGSYDNSYWDVPSQRIIYFSGKEFTGEVSVYKNKVFETVLYKDTCVNVLVTQKKHPGLIDEDQPKPNKVKVDSLGGGTTIINNITNNNNVNNYYGAKNDTIINESLKKENLKGHKDSVKWYNTTVARIGEGALLVYGGYKLAGLLRKKPPVVVPPVVTPPVVPPVDPRTMPPGIPAVPVVIPTPEGPGGIPSDPRTQPGGIPSIPTTPTTPETPETPTTPEPETPSTPGLDATPRGMPGGIGQTFFPSGRMITVGITIPAPWGR